MEASLSVQPQEEEEGASRIQSRDGSGVERPSWFRRPLGGLLMRKKHPAAAVEAPARARDERGPTETEKPRWRSSLKKAVGSALLACVCEPVCSGVHEDDVVDPRKRAPRRRRRQEGGICSGARSPPGICSGDRSPPEAAPTDEESEDDYWTFAFRPGRSSSLNDELLMRRLMLEEEAMRRRLEMRVVAGRCWFPPGPSRLSQMSLANDDDNGGRSWSE